MRFHALATDYDGTLARHGTVEESTLEALRQLRSSGRKLLMVTGRELPDLQRVFPHLDLFDRVVVENGALLYNPETREERVLATPPPPEFVERLRAAGIDNISVGRVIVATWEPHQDTVLQVIRDRGLELSVIFNKGAVMVLPTGINKATGLKAALEELHLSPHNVVSVGDAENDHAFLSASECGVAVSNALPAVKERVDIVTQASHGAGVAELIGRMVHDDLKGAAVRLGRHLLNIGAGADGQPALFAPYGENVMIAGTSGSGKTTLVTSFLEQLQIHEYQACVIDPEGDYGEIEGLLLFGDAERAATIEEIAKALEKPSGSVVANLLGVRLDDRPEFFHRLLAAVQELRARTGRPHWMVVDEAHHVLPQHLGLPNLLLPARPEGFLFVTVNPAGVAPAVLRVVDTLIAIGDHPERTIQTYCQAIGEPAPEFSPVRLNKGEALAWRRSTPAPFWFRVHPPRTARRRHIRKYAHGELAPDTSFYFEGPEKKLRLRAQNLQIFLQLADGVDDETWMHHLRQGEYSQWFREGIKDEELARAAEEVEKDLEITAAQSRERIRAEVEARYTAPA